MVPSAFVAMGALPLSPNGKVDRKALPAPAPEARAAVQPQSGSERRIAKVWEEVLGISGVGLDDNFFEIGEIEAALLAHPAVAQAAVVLRREAGGRLVAYLAPAADAAVPSVGELREHLRGRLPDYMVPSAFVAMDALPLSPNGKVDRKALPEPTAAPAAGAR